MSVTQTDPRSSPRRCVCCGAATATRSVPACWEHWTLLSQDLRSAIVIAYSRGQLTQYADCLDAAVKLWREAGVWRPPRTIAFARINASMRPPENVIPFRQRGGQTAALHTAAALSIVRVTNSVGVAHSDGDVGTRGRGNWRPLVRIKIPIHRSRSIRALLGRPLRPHVPLTDVTAKLPESVNAVSRTQHLN